MSPNPLEGIRAQQKIQKRRPEGYLKEVTVSRQIENEQFILEVGGRIDGVYPDPDRPIIEEIKTTSLSLDHVQQAENPRHWGQLKVYAYIYAVDKELDRVETQLTYYQLETGKTLELRRSFTRDELEAFFLGLVDRFLEWTARIEEWNRLRDESIRGLAFPFEAYRPGQRRMAVDVYRTVKDRGQLLVQAPTAIGKTMAAVFPSLKALSEGLTETIFYLTARTTGRTVTEKALDELRGKDLRAKSVTLTAKEKICFNPDKACNGDECAFARGYYDRLEGALDELFQHDAFTRARVEAVARKHQVCPFELSLDLSVWADCVICDYNYAFDPRVYLRRFFMEDRGDYTFLIDEAHNLVDRSREMFSAEIRKRPFGKLRRAVKNHELQLYRSLGRIDKWLRDSRKRCEVSGGSLSEKAPPEDLYPLLKRFTGEAERFLATHTRADVPYREDVLDVYFDAGRFLKVSEQYDEAYFTCYEASGRDLRLKLFCSDPSGQLGQALKRGRSAVFFSATLTPAEYFQSVLGCKEEARTIRLPSPFPPENLCLLINDRIATTYQRRDETKLRVSRSLAAFVKQKKGNYLLFLPSYEYMTSIYELFASECPDLESFAQAPGMREEERDRFLQRFGEENDQHQVGFAVMGGIFAEGIDLVGERLTGAAIVSVGLPGLSPERERIRDHFTQKDDTGFEFAYLFPGMNRVLQAAGRVIRSEQDRGAILLIDQRFSHARYRSLFPPEWNPVRVRDEEQIQEVLARFWARS